jgi:hypothetical protein
MAWSLAYAPRHRWTSTEIDLVEAAELGWKFVLRVGAC